MNSILTKKKPEALHLEVGTASVGFDEFRIVRRSIASND